MTFEQVGKICLDALPVCDVKPYGQPYLREGKWIIGFQRGREMALQVEFTDREISETDLWRMGVELENRVRGALMMSE